MEDARLVTGTVTVCWSIEVPNKTTDEALIDAVNSALQQVCGVELGDCFVGVESETICVPRIETDERDKEG